MISITAFIFFFSVSSLCFGTHAGSLDGFLGDSKTAIDFLL